MGKRSNLQELLDTNRRRLGVLCNTKATFGISTAPEILLEIEDIQEEIASIEQKIKELAYEVDDPSYERNKHHKDKYIYLWILIPLIVLIGGITIMSMLRANNDTPTPLVANVGTTDPTDDAGTSETIVATSTSAPIETIVQPTASLPENPSKMLQCWEGDRPQEGVQYLKIENKDGKPVVFIRDECHNFTISERVDAELDGQDRITFPYQGKQWFLEMTTNNKNEQDGTLWGIVDDIPVTFRGK